MTSKTDAMIERLDRVLAQLEELGATPQVDVPATRLDAYGNPSLVAAGELIESAWGNSVGSRVVYQFPNGSALSAFAAANGTLAELTDQGSLFMRRGGAWVQIAGIPMNFRLIGGPTGQTMAPNVAVQAAWTTENDPFNVCAGGVFTVPAGFAGRWAFEWSVQWGIGGANGLRSVYLTTSVPGVRGGEHSDVGQEAGTRLSGSYSAVLPVGGTANITMYHSDNAGFLTCNPSTNNYYQGYYVGPV